MLGVADGAGSSGSTIGGVAEEEAARDRFFLRVPPDCQRSCSVGHNWTYNIPIFIHNRRKQAKLACINNGYLTCILS
jgi:hypothetical protein